jgi:hypothetical protein
MGAGESFETSGSNFSVLAPVLSPAVSMTSRTDARLVAAVLPVHLVAGLSTPGRT